MSNTFGDRLNELIEESKMKKVQFAHKIGVDQSYIPQLISGKRTPSDRVVRDICSACGVNKEWLCDGVLPKYSTQNTVSLDALADAHNLSRKDRDIIKGFLELDEAQRNTVLNMLRGLVESSDTE